MQRLMLIQRAAKFHFPQVLFSKDMGARSSDIRDDSLLVIKYY
jgi:hypothetical protein